jgi:ATP-dependent DNA helicase RecQ
VLVVQATGWGKSAVYWVASAIRRAEGAGPTLVVSPLLSLMRDQVEAARRAGLRAATVNSSNVDDWSAIESALVSDEVDVLLVSPERLANPGFGRRVLDAVAGRIGLLVVDEAHAVSDWGHDFRPDYRRVAALLQRLSPDTPVLATTATANARVTDDVADQLGDTTLVLRGALARPSLELVVTPMLSPLQRYAWVVEHLPTLPGSGIVYTLTVADAERLAAVITEVHGASCPVAAYTGGLDGDERLRLEAALKADEVKALVATSALGMGYDKPDLGFVVHVGSPPSPVSYYQQVGRAGRAIDHAPVVLLPSKADTGVWDYFATATIPVPEQVERVLARLSEALPGEPASVAALEAETGIRRTRVELMLKQLAVDGAVDRVDGGWVRTDAPWSYDAEHYDALVAVRNREADIMRRYVRADGCLMQLLQEALDDPTAEPCGRCSVCRGGLPASVAGAPTTDMEARVAGVLRGETHVLEPRKMWPGGEFGTRGRIPAELMAEPGRVLVLADAPEWRDVVAEVSGTREVPADLLDGAVRLMTGWRQDWAVRPDVVVALPTGSLPGVAEAVSAHLAGVGRLTQVGLDVGAPDRQTDDLSGPQEAAMWRQRLSLGTEATAAVDGRCVLLVVDSTSTQWPVTVAAAALRESGATHVLPLLVHRRP